MEFRPTGMFREIQSLTVPTCMQANAVSDRVLDLRMCDFSGKDLSGKTLSGALLKDALLPNTLLRETVFSKVCFYHCVHALVNPFNFEASDFSYP